MSNGGVFKLLANDGRADRMIYATDLLNSRIRDIMCQRRSARMADVTPTLADIEKTHILFFNAHYRPHAATGYEYTKVRPQSGNITYGGRVQFSIPAYGEFFADMVCRMSLGPVSCVPSVVPGFPAPIGSIDLITDAVHQESGNADPVAHQYTKYTQEYVRSNGDVVTVGAAASNYIRYCEYPGEMIFNNVKFEVNSNPLDEYKRDVVFFYRKYWVLHDKEIGWKRMVGQEVPIEAYTQSSAVSGANAYRSPMANLVDIAGNTVGPVNSSITARQVCHIVQGPQTPKAVQPALDLWVPLLFWFNRDIRTAIPSVSIPYGQRFITIDLENQRELLYRAPGDLYLRTTVEVRTDAGGIGTGTAIAQGVHTVDRQVTMEPVLISDSVVSTTQTLDSELYMNSLFVNPEIHDIYIKRIGFTLVRVHRRQSAQVTTSNNDMLLSQLKWPTEYIYVGLMPSYNIDPSNPNKYRDWHNLTRINESSLYNVAHSTGVAQISNIPAPWPTDIRNFSHAQSIGEIIVPVSIPTIDSLKVTVQGNDIVSEFGSKFFSDYTPWYYGQNVLRTPSDSGAMLINFSLYPGTYQPSGHINISRAREFYIRYVSSYCSPATPCEFIAIGIAINFLLVSDGSAVLRFTS